MAANWTLTQSINQLLSGSPNNSNINTIWTGSTLTYAFPNYANQIGRPGGEVNFAPLGSSARETARLCMNLWDDLIRPAIAEVSPATSNNYYDQKYMMALGHSLSPDYAYAYLPWSYGSSIWFNQSYDSSWGTSDIVTPQIGEHGFLTYMHEIGHALVLSHMGDYNGADNNGPSSIQDSTVFTIMSYYGPSWGDYAWAGYGTVEWADWVGDDGYLYSPQTPMLYDVYAIQKAYGTDTTTRVTNTVYGFNSNITGVRSAIYNFSQNLHPIITIYDAGGVDTLDFSGWSSSSSISLASGSYSSANGMTKNIWIAYGVVIENAVGGSGNDSIVGNAADNNLNGGAGIDTIYGGSGNDTIVGGAGNDAINGELGLDYVYFSGRFVDYTVSKSGDTYSIAARSGTDGMDAVINCEYFVFSDQTRTSSNLISDSTLPGLLSVAVSTSGATIVLTYDKTLGSVVPLPAAFAITVNGKPVAVSAVAAVDSTIELTLARAIRSGESATLSYSAPRVNPATSNAAIQDTSGNDALKLTSVSVTNNSTLPAPDLTAPVFQGAATSANGEKIILTYSESLGSVVPMTKSFVVTVAGKSMVVSSVAAVGSTIELTLASTIQSGQAVFVSYTAPKVNSGTSNAAIQDTSGNDALKLIKTTVTNLAVSMSGPALSEPLDGPLLYDAAPVGFDGFDVQWTGLNSLDQSVSPFTWI